MFHGYHACFQGKLDVEFSRANGTLRWRNNARVTGAINEIIAACGRLHWDHERVTVFLQRRWVLVSAPSQYAVGILCSAIAGRWLITQAAATLTAHPPDHPWTRTTQRYRQAAPRVLERTEHSRSETA